MYYRYDQVIKRDKNKLLMIALAFGFAAALTLGMLGMASAAKKTAPTNAGSIGKVTFDTNVAWDGTEMFYGDGIPNGEWIVAETQGVQLGARVTDRTDGTLDVSGDKGNRVGVYEALTGTDGTTDFAEWSYEWSVDLSNAKGNAKGKTLADYKLVLEQDYTEQSLFEGLFPGFPGLGSDPVVLTMPDVCDPEDNPRSDTLCQQSWNPTFGNTDFNINAEGTYNLRFVLTPSTFNGPSVAVTVQVVVTNP